MNNEPNVTEPIKTFIRERLASPLTSAYFVSWLIINYKIPLIIFTSSSIDYKIDLLNSYFSDSYYLHFPTGLQSLALLKVSSFIYVYLLPLLYALAYIYIYPYFNIKVIKHANKTKKAEQDEHDMHVQHLLINSLKDDLERAKQTYNDMQTSHSVQITELQAAHQTAMNEFQKSTHNELNHLRERENELMQNLTAYRPIQAVDPAIQDILEMMLERYNSITSDGQATKDEIFSLLHQKHHTKAQSTYAFVQLKQNGSLTTQDSVNYILSDQGIMTCQQYGLVQLKPA